MFAKLVFSGMGSGMSPLDGCISTGPVPEFADCEGQGRIPEFGNCGNKGIQPNPGSCDIGGEPL
jgi:hypothetical protein